MENPGANRDVHNSSGDKQISPSLNLTGSPLKDDLSVNELLSHSIANNIHFSKPWDDIEQIYTPIDIKVAREIITNISNQKFPNNSSGWIFILCSDKSAPVWDSTFLLSSFIKSNQFVRGFANYMGVVKHENKSMDNLLKRHYSFISPTTKLNTRMESIFKISPDVSLKFVNNSFSQNPSIDHIDETSEVVLYQKVEIGKHILCEDFWSQIQLLNMIKTEIISYKNCSVDGTFSEPNYNYGSADMTFENLQDKVNRILSEVNIAEGADAIVNNGLEAVIKRAGLRQLTEISDQVFLKFIYFNTFSSIFINFSFSYF